MKAFNSSRCTTIWPEGSRDKSKGVAYCSRICCMYAAKHGLLFKEHNQDGQAYVFYMDLRAAGKNYEEFA